MTDEKDHVPGGDPPEHDAGPGQESEHAPKPPADDGAGEGSQAPPPPPEGGAPPPAAGAMPPPPAGGGAAEANNDARMWAMLAHLLALCGYFIFPLGNLLVPLVVWQMKKNDYEYVDYHGKESLNFQITVSIIGLVLFVLSWIPFVVCITGPLGLILWAFGIVFTIIAGIKANNGERYAYPMTLRLI